MKLDQEFFISNSVQDTKEIAKKIIKKFSNEKIFIIKGDLGVGKTVFVKGITEFMNIKDKVTSPTFGFKNLYDNLIFHYDLFIKDKSNFDNSFFSQLLEDMDNGIVFIEWGEKIKLKKLKNYVFIEIKKVKEKREINSYKVKNDRY